MFCGVHFFFYYQHGSHVEWVTIIESFPSMRQGGPLGIPLFVLAHYWAFLKTIMWAPNCVFPSIANDTHIVGPMYEIICAFDHLLTQLALVGLRVKVLKCKFWNPLRISLGIKIFPGCILSYMVYTFWVCQWIFRTLLCFFGWGFILRCSAYQWSFFCKRHLGYFGHFVLMCNY